MRIIKALFPLVISGALSACAVLILRDHLQYMGIVEDLSAWGSFFNVFGVIYAIVAGFLLITVLNRYSSLNQALEDELNAVESTRDFLVYLGDEERHARAAMKQALSHYVTSVANEEWEQMSDSRTPMNSDTSEELYEVMRKGKEIRGASERYGVILSALVESITEIAKMRTRRIALANERLPTRLRILMVFMSVTLVSGFLLLGVQAVFPHVFMLVTLTASVHLLYMIVDDLDHPFYGVWNISRTQLDELVRRFEEELRLT